MIDAIRLRFESDGIEEKSEERPTLKNLRVGHPQAVPCSTSGLGGVFFLFVLVEFFEEAIDVGFLDVVGGGEAEFAGVGSADADFVGVPEPVFEVEAEDGGTLTVTMAQRRAGSGEVHDVAPRFCISARM